MLLICWFCVLGYPYIKCTDASLMHLGVIFNGNWTEWSAIWSKIMRVISNLNKSAARVQFEITSMISDQNCTTRSLIPGLFLRSESGPIGHVRYINIQAWLRGFRVKIANFSSFFCPSIPMRDLDTKETTPNMEVWPESPRAMLEYWYIERGLLTTYIQNTF